MINKMVQSAFSHAKKKSKKVENSQRSKVWVEKLATEFRKKFKSPKYRVFSSDYYENRKAFKINELLYDISVVQIETIESASKKTELEYISSCEWLVESEFHRSNSRESIIDLSKLFMGNSTHKLLVLPKSTTIATWVIDELVNIFPLGEDQYYLALVPHPNDWYPTEDMPEDMPEVYVLKHKEWVKLKN